MKIKEIITQEIPGQLVSLSVDQFANLKKGDIVFVNGGSDIQKGVFIQHEHWRFENSHAEIDLNDSHRHSFARQWVHKIE